MASIVERTAAYAAKMEALQQQRSARNARITAQRQRREISADDARRLYDASEMEHLNLRGDLLRRIMGL